MRIKEVKTFLRHCTIFFATNKAALKQCVEKNKAPCGASDIALPQAVLSGLVVAKVGFAFLDKCRHAFLLVSGGERGVEATAFEQQAFLQTGFIGAID